MIPVKAAGAQEAMDSTLSRAMEHENGGRFRQAAVAYRASLSTPNFVIAMLGLERAYSELGQVDTTLFVVDSALRSKPKEGMFRTVQLRSLRTLRRTAELERAFETWVREIPGDPSPFRDYARHLLDDGRALGADSVLRRAQQLLGSASGFRIELAQTRSALGEWEPAGRAWRDAVTDAAYLEQAAVFSLAQAPREHRDVIRAVLAAAPTEITPRRVLSALELSWGSPSQAWEALRVLPRGDSTAAAWKEFAERAESAESWSAARDAFRALLELRADPEIAARAANAALNAGDPAAALALAEGVALADSMHADRAILSVRVRALAMLRRPEDAANVVRRYASALSGADRAALEREVAWAWVRAGDMPRARAALAAAGSTEDADEVTGWLALYDGDLKTARTALRRATSSEAVRALALLARTRADSAPQVGAAYLALARGDSASAARSFEQSAAVLSDAAPLLLVTAARLRAARKENAAAIALWTTVVERFPETPEAAESDLDWARALVRGGDADGARKRFEHLILTYPNSALVPQARRELDLLRNSVPPPRRVTVTREFV